MKLKPMAAACTAAVLLSGTHHFALAAPGDSWTFSNCSVEGRLGPPQGDCDTEYTGTSLDGIVTVSGGIQSWVVPEAGTYQITALGAAGGTQQYTGDEGSGTVSPGGLGASIQGTFELTAGETIYVLVGQMGGDTKADTDTDGDWESAAPGGGGGTFVYRSPADPFPLLAAGGGGSGSNCETVNASLQNGSITESGNSADFPAFREFTNGGSDGNGGTENYDDDAGSSYWAGGGAGWLTDGTGGQNTVDYNYLGEETEDGDGGRTPANGATGGERGNDSGNLALDEGGDGGFGGGGGGGSDNMGGGGGGGFSGGGGADGESCTDGSAPYNRSGGGGGSYNSGVDPVNTAAANAGHGQVLVSQLAGGGNTAEPPKPVPTLGIWGIGILSGMIGLLGMYHRRRK